MHQRLSTMRGHLSLIVFLLSWNSLLLGQEITAIRDWHMAQLRNCGAITGRAHSSEVFGWFVSRARPDGKVETDLIGADLRPIWPEPLVSGPEQFATEVVHGAGGHLVVLADGNHRIQVKVDGGGHQRARRKVLSTGWDPEAITAGDLFTMRKAPGTVLPDGRGGFLVLERKGLERRNMVLVALDSLLNVRWTHELRSTLTTTTILRVLDIGNGGVLCTEVLVRDYLAPVFEPRPPLNGPLRIQSSALVRLDQETGMELQRIALDHEELHYMPLSAWPRSDAPGHVITGQIYGRGYGAIGAFITTDNANVEGWASGAYWYTNLLADTAMSADRSNSMPVLAAAVRRTDGTVVQAGEFQSIQVDNLAGDVISIIGIATGQVGLGSPANVRYTTGDLLWLEWPAMNERAIARSLPRQARPGYHDQFDGSLNFWGAFETTGNDVALFFSDKEAHQGLVVHSGARPLGELPLPGLPSDLPWIAFPPAQGRLPVLIGPTGGEPLYMKLIDIP